MNNILKKAATSFIVFMLIATQTAFAHGTDSKSMAPDLHPLLVAVEFIVIMLAGYKLSVWLASMKGKKQADTPE